LFNRSILIGPALLFASTAQGAVNISAQPTQNMSCSGGVCTATAPKAVLNVTDLTNLLASGDTTVKTGGAAKDIVVKAALSWTSASRLTLDAQQTVEIAKPVAVAGNGALTIATNDGGQNGEFLIDPKQSVQFWNLASSLVINGNSYTLVSDFHTLASDIATNPSGNFALAKDYKGHEKFSATPIQSGLTGRFEGLGNTISHIKVRDFTNFSVGLFTGLGYMSEVENLRLSDITIVSRRTGGSQAGALAGALSGVVRNVSTSGRVSAGGAAGGLIGASSGSIIHSSSTCTVSGGEPGGLVGDDNGSIATSYASGSVTGGPSAYAGGLVGFAAGDVIDRSFAIGAVTAGKQSDAGGLVGFHGGGQIQNSYALSSVTAKASSSVGGLVGVTPGGGLLTVQTSYSVGAITSGGYAGGVVGYDGGDNFDDTYWDLDSSGVSDPGQGQATFPTTLESRASRMRS
jgi:hypothetical protein